MQYITEWNKEGIADTGSGPNLTQTQIMELLELQIRKYTMGESSSVSTEVARRLFESIRFAFAFYEENSCFGDTPVDILDRGTQLIWSLTQKVRSLYELANSARLPVDNQSYNDTYAALLQFFRYYNYRFFAHEIPCMPDYQLAAPVPVQLQGIRYIQDYLMRLTTENRLCRCFDQKLLITLLKKSYRDYKGLLINIMEPVLKNALGLILLKQNPMRLFITEEERLSLFEMFHPWNQEFAEKLTLNGIELLCSKIKITDSFSLNYLKTCAVNQLPGMRHTEQNAWQNIFLS